MTPAAQAAIRRAMTIEAGIREQADHVLHHGAPITARVVLAQLALMRAGGQVARRIAEWPGDALEDAMPLRLAGGLHWLHLAGREAALRPVYDGSITGQAAVDRIVVAAARDHADTLLPWFDRPPQTNEAGRSAGFMAMLLWLSARAQPRFELLEIGASAGVNTMMGRYRYDLGGVEAGPAESPMRITSEWRGPPPPAGPVEIVSMRGCDANPIDLTDPAAGLRLKSYIWPDAPARFARMEAAIALASETAPDLANADAADWIEEQLARPQLAGVTRALAHSIVWQYLPEATRRRIETAMERAARDASAERPLAWIELETNRATFRHELKLRHWPGGGGHLLGEAHAHGTWISWFGGDSPDHG